MQAATHYNDANVIAEVSRGLGDGLPGLDVRSISGEQRLALRGAKGRRGLRPPRTEALLAVTNAGL